MVETAAHLVDHIVPYVAAVRQWVLSFPWPMRMRFAARPGAFSRCHETQLLQRAGLRQSRGARTDIVTLTQRHGSAATLVKQPQCPRCTSD